MAIKCKFYKEDIDEKGLLKYKENKIKFPVNFLSIEGGKFLGDLFTDGCFQTNGTINYSNLDIKQIKINKNATRKLFGKVHYSIKRNKKTRVYDINHSGILSLFLDKIKIPRGPKVISNPKIPDFIENAPPQIKCAFLRRIIANEATVTKDGQICIKQAIKKGYKPNLLIGYCTMFKSLGIPISCTRISRRYSGKKCDCTVWELYTRPYEFSKIVNEIGFDSDTKLSKALKFLKDKKRAKLSRTERKLIILKELDIAGDPISIDFLLSKVDIKRTALQDYLYRLMNAGKVKRSIRKFYPNGSDPFYYTLNVKP